MVEKEKNLNNVECNECGEQFIINERIRKHPNAIEETYFKCPHCNYEYTVLVTDPPLRKEIKEIKKLHERYIRRRNKATARSEVLKSKLEADKVMQDAIEAVDDVLDDWTDEI